MLQHVFNVAQAIEQFRTGVGLITVVKGWPCGTLCPSV